MFTILYDMIDMALADDMLETGRKSCGRCHGEDVGYILGT